MTRLAGRLVSSDKDGWPMIGGSFARGLAQFAGSFMVG
jgi:hypothetical protein